MYRKVFPGKVKIFKERSQTWKNNILVHPATKDLSKEEMNFTCSLDLDNTWYYEMK